MQNYSEAVLRWHLDIGVDETITSSPVSKFNTADALSGETTASAPAAPVVESLPLATKDNSSLPDKSLVAPFYSAEAIAVEEKLKSINTLSDLKDFINTFDGCSLKKTATNTVISRGSEASELMIIGEAPGADEDREGLPFVGRSGQLLDAMLAAAGFEKEQAYITNIVFWRPPGNRKPNPSEIGLCLPFVRRHIALKKPKAILLLGGVAVQSLFGDQDFVQNKGITKLRGDWIDYTSKDLETSIPTIASYHPAYLLRTPIAKKLAWMDLLELQARLTPVQK